MSGDQPLNENVCMPYGIQQVQQQIARKYIIECCAVITL